MIPKRLDLYIARRFCIALSTIALAVTVIVFLADYVEVLRRFSDDDGFNPALGLRLVLMRVPLLLDTVLPFAVLFAAILSLVTLSQRLELVVARASGISVWGFLKAPLALAVVAGALATAVLHPLAVALKDEADKIEAELSGSAERRTAGLWLRQEGPDGPSIVRGGSVSDDGRSLFGVTAFVFDRSGAFREKVTARRADYAEHAWHLAEAEVISAASAPRRVAHYALATELNPAELQSSIVQRHSASLWLLPGLIRTAERTGLDPDRYRLAFHALISRPLLLVAMVLIAANVSLRLMRYGGTLRLVLTGVGVGFLLYVLTEVASDLGGNGIINPILAAWLPPTLALTLGATVLLYQEDG